MSDETKFDTSMPASRAYHAEMCAPSSGGPSSVVDLAKLKAAADEEMKGLLNAGWRSVPALLRLMMHDVRLVMAPTRSD
ncbi:hypothetical protein [Streptomyces sp. NRRL F-5135]|uniref:hypothetical protein n=1 Tax=Streptomyces sp. NRRL F-5135 TaxID=1463858 RepID=UPI00131E7E82|nr:hypothetical protein [Streptomyces sp. NRRL F-5135]